MDQLGTQAVLFEQPRVLGNPQGCPNSGRRGVRNLDRKKLTFALGGKCQERNKNNDKCRRRRNSLSHLDDRPASPHVVLGRKENRATRCYVASSRRRQVRART